MAEGWTSNMSFSPWSHGMW